MIRFLFSICADTVPDLAGNIIWIRNSALYTARPKGPSYYTPRCIRMDKTSCPYSNKNGRRTRLYFIGGLRKC